MGQRDDTHLKFEFAADYSHFWSNLSRFNNLLIIVNISLFFLTGLVAQGYYYTIYSLLCLGGVGIAAVVPTALIRRLWYYGVFLTVEVVGLYFLVASVAYWVSNGPV